MHYHRKGFSPVRLCETPKAAWQSSNEIMITKNYVLILKFYEEIKNKPGSPRFARDDDRLLHLFFVDIHHSVSQRRSGIIQTKLVQAETH